MSATTKVLGEVERERQRQQQKGWTTAHDDEHSTSEMVGFILKRTKPQCMLPSTAHCTGSSWEDWDDTRRKLLVEIAALAVAAIESIDRRAAVTERSH